MKTKNTFELSDTMLRLLGLIGFFVAVIAGFLLTGGQIHWLVHPPEMIIVLGIRTHRTFSSIHSQELFS